MAKPTNELTPMQRQYQQIKEQNSDCILFFRLGDFYEMFNEDAKGGRPGAGSDPDQPGPQQAQGGADPHVRRALSQRGLLHCPAGAEGLQGCHLRADDGPRPQQGAGGAGDHPHRHPRHRHRKLHAGRKQETPTLPGWCRRATRLPSASR